MHNKKIDQLSEFEAVNKLIDLSWIMATEKINNKHIDLFRILAAKAKLDIESKEIISNQIKKWKQTIKQWEYIQK